MRHRILFLLSLIVMASCLNDKDYNLGDVTLTPTVAFPLAFGDMGLVNLLSKTDSAFVKTDADGLLYFYYVQTLPSKDIHDLFSLPDNTTTTGIAMPPGTLPGSASNTVIGPINRLIDLNLSPEELTEILLKTGSLNYNISFSQPTSPPNLPIEVALTLTDVVEKTTQQPLTFNAAGTGSRLLKDYIIRMNSNKFNIRLDLVIKPHAATFIPAGTKVNVQLTFGGMDYSYIKGFLGDQTTPLPPQTNDISVFGSSLNGASVSFVQPMLTMKMVNDYGVACEVNFTKLQAKKPGAVLPFQISPANPISLNSPTTMGTSATTNVTVSNGQAILNFAPTQLEYAATVRINKGLSNATNFLADTSKLRITTITQIPVYGQVSGVTILDTLKIDLSSVKESSISSASLKISANNEMPLDANMQIYFADESFHVKDSLFTPNQTYIVKASTVKATGELLAAGISDQKLGLDPARIIKLFESKHLIIKAKMNTARDSNGALLNVKFKASYRLKLHIGLLAKLKVTL